MTLLLAVLAALVTLAIGRVMVRLLGWPRDLNGAMRWAMALLVLAALYAGLPDLLDLVRRMEPPPAGGFAPLPSIRLVDACVGFLLLGLGGLGHVAWTRSAMEREAHGRQADAHRFQERRRASPPPPGADDFEALDPPDDAP